MASFEQRTLETPGQNAQRRLMEQEGVDLLQPGGFAKRDAIRQAVSEDVQTQKRKSRAANLAYRQAVRQGDRKGALGILLAADEAGIQFGGVRAAGRDQQRAVLERGEKSATARDIEEQEGEELGADVIRRREELVDQIQQAEPSGGLRTGALRTGGLRTGGLSGKPTTAWERLAAPGSQREPKKGDGGRKRASATERGEAQTEEILQLLKEREDFLLNRTKMA